MSLSVISPDPGQDISFLAAPAGSGKGMMPPAGTAGQSTPGTPKARLPSGHDPPRPGGLAASCCQPRPGGSAAGHAIHTVSYARGQDRDRQQDAASLREDRR